MIESSDFLLWLSIVMNGIAATAWWRRGKLINAAIAVQDAETEEERRRALVIFDVVSSKER